MEAKHMYEVNISNCNNIRSGNIKIAKDKLNIKYGINGTGKTTISRTISNANSTDKMKELQTYYSDDPAQVSIVPCFNNILTFDESFVNQIVFKENNEVIENSFEIFIKTPTYDARKSKLDVHLSELKKLMEQDTEITALRDSLTNLYGKFTITSTVKLSKKGALGSILSSNNLFNIPQELKNYKPFITNHDTNINWIAWKTQGDKFDTIDKCPFCADTLPTTHKKEQEIFSKTYKKSDSQNLKEVVDLFESLKDYIDETKYATLMGYIKSDTPEDTIKVVVSKLYTELDLLVKKFNAIIDFGQKQIAIADISSLGVQIDNMEIPKQLLEYFGGEHISGIIDRINNKVEKLKNELVLLKKEMGDLKGTIQATIKESQKDINDFLKTAGINYELEIQANDEKDSKTILEQCFNSEKSEVTNIRSHLSWGEKNAFSLILFMYYATEQKPDLIILDDPISSFDSNKKFAILHRMFKRNIGNKDVSLSGRTVLLLTHDFEPITDFIVVGKLPRESVNASFIWNKNGIVRERQIDPDTDIKLISVESQEIAQNTSVNTISRIAFLRKLCELHNCVDEWGFAYEILSSLSLIHGCAIRKKIGNDEYTDMDITEIDKGTSLIKKYIPEYDFDKLKSEVYIESGLKSLYANESNEYFKLQIFRTLCEISNKIEISPVDEAWFKFIDETYHIENDYLHFLDLMKFDIVPDYIAQTVSKMMDSLS
jgi:energy-coupling factor transporter ATP-binding protein EcfA2